MLESLVRNTIVVGFQVAYLASIQERAEFDGYRVPRGLRDWAVPFGERARGNQG